jgi:hypothetical protein
VETADVFLPNWLFKKPKGGPYRNDVFRANVHLFSKAFEYRQGRLSLEQFNLIVEQLASELSFSEIETEVFRNWTDVEMQKSREYFRGELAVRRRQNDIDHEF